MRPWVKRPVDLLEHSAVVDLELKRRWLYSCLFDRAARVPRAMLGFLLDADGAPAGIRTIAGWAAMPRSTAHRYLDELQHRGLVEADIFGFRKVPLVISTERRFARSEHSTTPATAVDNSDPGASQKEGGVPVRGPNWDASDDPLLVVLDLDTEANRHDVLDVAVENPPRGPRYELLPSPLADTATGHCLAKLAADHERWRHLLVDPRDRANLVSLQRQSPSDLYDLVAAQAQNPTALNPIAYLNFAIADRVRLAEASS